MNEKLRIKVSIIVPVYNVENYLERCLDSLINQSLKYYIATSFLGNIRAHFKQLVSKNYNISEKRKIARKIVNDELVQNILIWYPYKLTPMKQRLFSEMIKMKRVDLLLLFGKLQSLR